MLGEPAPFSFSSSCDEPLAMSAFHLDPKHEAEIRNALLIAEDLREKRRVWRGRPFHVEISTNNACNLSCVMCERPDLDFIQPSLFESIAGDLFPAASVVTPSATSEPAMGDFDAIVDHCERHDLKLNMITNGNLITDRHIERLRGRLYRVDFSMDSHIPSVYEEIRVGGSHARMLAGLRRLVRLQQEEGFRLTIVVVLMRQNLTTLDALLSFARAEGVKNVRVQKLLPFFSNPERFHVEEHFTPEEIRHHLDRARRAADREGVHLILDLDPRMTTAGPSVEARNLSAPMVMEALFDAITARNPGFCYQLASYVRIIPNGNLYPCCRGWKETLRMGNVNDDSASDIWNGAAYMELREQFFGGKLNERCRTCTLSGQGSL